MSAKKVLITCPPMLKLIDEFRPIFAKKNIEITCPNVVQTLTENEILTLLPGHVGWIIGDDPANANILTSASDMGLKVLVKWGIGTDSIDIPASKTLGILFSNTPNMLGKEVADIALSYTIALARETFLIDRSVRIGNWYKPTGVSLAGKTAALIGYGDIGKNIAKRLQASDVFINIYDPQYNKDNNSDSIKFYPWPDKIDEADFIILACSLNSTTRGIIHKNILKNTKQGVYLINVSRGGLVDQKDLIEALSSGHVKAAALDVFENEPLNTKSPLLNFPNCILGSHNASNTFEAVRSTSHRSIELLFNFLDIN